MDHQEVVSLKNHSLQVSVLPSCGGKISSIRSIRTGEEFLLPPLRQHGFVSPTDTFDKSDCGGFDDCLPSVAACPSVNGQALVPDHGDVWRMPWAMESLGEDIVLQVDLASRPLRMRKQVALRDNSMLVRYSLENLSSDTVHWLWSAHPLLQIEAGDRIVLPPTIDKALVEYSADATLERHVLVPWPRTPLQSGEHVHLDAVRARDGITAYKLFAEMGQQGWAGLYRDAIQQGVVIRFDPHVLPFLGIWICYGAWPHGSAIKQYTVALEPTTSNTDSLLAAQTQGTSASLEAYKSCQWSLEFELMGSLEPIDIDAFTRLASS